SNVSNCAHERARVATAEPATCGKLNRQGDRSSKHQFRRLLSCEMDESTLAGKDSLTGTAQRSRHSNRPRIFEGCSGFDLICGSQGRITKSSFRRGCRS